MASLVSSKAHLSRFRAELFIPKSQERLQWTIINVHSPTSKSLAQPPNDQKIPSYATPSSGSPFLSPHQTLQQCLDHLAAHLCIYRPHTFPYNITKYDWTTLKRQLDGQPSPFSSLESFSCGFCSCSLVNQLVRSEDEYLRVIFAGLCVQCQSQRLSQDLLVSCVSLILVPHLLSFPFHLISPEHEIDSLSSSPDTDLILDDDDDDESCS